MSLVDRVSKDQKPLIFFFSNFRLKDSKTMFYFLVSHTPTSVDYKNIEYTTYVQTDYTW